MGREPGVGAEREVYAGAGLGTGAAAWEEAGRRGLGGGGSAGLGTAPQPELWLCAGSACWG